MSPRSRPRAPARAPRRPRRRSPPRAGPRSGPARPARDPPSTALRPPGGRWLEVVGVVDGVLSAARALLHCELVALNVLSEEAVLTARVQGHLPGLSPGVRATRSDTLCHLLVERRPGRDVRRPLRPALLRRAGRGAPSACAATSACSSATPEQRGRRHAVRLRPLPGRGRRRRPRRPAGPGRRPDALRRRAARARRRSGPAGRPLARRRRAARGAGVRPGPGAGERRGPGGPAAQEGERPRRRTSGPSCARPSATLERATAARVEVEQAVGRVAERLGLPPLEAYRVLERAAAASGTSGRLGRPGRRGAPGAAPRRLSDGPARPERRVVSSASRRPFSSVGRASPW